MRRLGASPQLILSALLLAGLLLLSSGCGGGAVSEDYFALAEGNSWLYKGDQEGVEYTLEAMVTRPDPSFGLGEDILDLAVTGSLGDFTVSEHGLYLEVGPDEVRLWGVEQGGAPPSFFQAPYIWLAKPLEVGREYNTAIQGAPTPSLMVVTGETKAETPWGARDGFTLEEKSGSGAAGGVRLVFVPYLGFTRISMPGIPELELEDASLR